MDKDTVKERVLAAIDDSQDEIIGHAREVWEHPELGFKERETAQKIQAFFDRLGLSYQQDLALTGVRADVSGRKSEARVAVLGELDAIIVRDHPAADPETGAVHACGHHAQQAVMLAAATGLVKSGAMDQLDGDVAFIAVPAEEYIELDYRNHLRSKGSLEFLGGKQELIRLGVMDDIDMAAMVHSMAETPERVVKIIPGNNGFLGKLVKYTGHEAHGGLDPYNGINALNAAMLGLMAIHANRETFRDEDSIRVHPIITKGGDMVNNVPAEVTIESYVRGRNIEAILDANVKVNRSLEAGALAVGAEVDITEIPGYLPMRNDPGLNKLLANNVRALLGPEGVEEGQWRGGSTDMGDLSHLMPAIHPYAGGISGKTHARTFEVTDEDMAYIVPGKALAMMVVDLLWDGAAEARKVTADFEPVYTRDEYLAMWRNLTG